MIRKNVAVVYLAGLLQGLTLVAFPAASSVFIHDFHFSSASYGSLFVPQAICSIIASFLSSKLKNAFLWGLFANLLSMALFSLSALYPSYGVLLFSTGILGLGFGLTVPSINTYAAQYFPRKIDSAILILNALLGLGTALAPVLTALFIGFSAWWGLPVLLGAILLLLLLFALTLCWNSTQTTPTKKTPHSRQFWMFAAFALLYGMIETMNGNWSTVYMSKNQQANNAMASFALTAFWGMVTLGRLFFSLLSEKITFRANPFIAAISFIIIAIIPTHNPVLAIFAFGLAGFGCSALLPLTISLGTKAISKTVAGDLIAFYLLGYGVSAFGVGAIHMNLSTIFGACSVLAIVLGALSFCLTGRDSAASSRRQQ